jgi:hypothetical protein
VLLIAVRRRIVRLVKRHGIDLEQPSDEEHAADERLFECPAYAEIQGAAVAGRVATGPRAQADRARPAAGASRYVSTPQEPPMPTRRCRVMLPDCLDGGARRGICPPCVAWFGCEIGGVGESEHASDIGRYVKSGLLSRLSASAARSFCSAWGRRRTATYGSP